MDIPPPSSASRPAGYATIAIASAAGVIAASRMSRPALVLAASLALAWWKKHQHSRSTVTEAPQPRASTPAPASPPEVPEPAPVPESPLAATAPPANFWQPLEPEVTFTEEPAATAPEVILEISAAVAETLDTFEPPPPDSPEVESPPPAPIWAPEASVELPPLPSPAFIQPETPPAPIDPAPPISFPIAPVRPEAPLADAWDDLRAALTPALGKGGKSSGPLPPVPATDEPATIPLPRIEALEMPEMYIFPPSSPLLDTLDEDEPLPADTDAMGEAPTVPLTYLNVPAMPEMNVFPASSPLIASSEDEEEVLPSHPSPPAYDSLHYFPQPSSEPVGEIPDEIHLPGMTEEEIAAAVAESGFLVTDPPVAAEPTTPQFVHAFAPPAIVSRVTPAPEADSVTPEASKPLTAPVIVPREVQAKKSFFDWLRS